MSGVLHLVAHIGGCGVLFDTDRVASVVELDVATPTPGAGSAVIGLAAMRSKVATVLDVRRLLDLPPRVVSEGARIGHAVAAMVDGHLYAIAVDSLEDIGTFTIEAPPAGLGAPGDGKDSDAEAQPGWDFVSGVADGSGETLIVLDIERLVERASAIA